MIYKNEVLINWQNPNTKDEILVRDEIIQIQNRYFSDNTHGIVRVLYPAGEPDLSVDSAFAPLKIFPLRPWSSNGEWRWTKSRMTTKNKTNPKGFVDSYVEVRHGDVLTKKDIELIWFMLNRSSDLNKKIFIEDLEGKAKEKVEEMSTDADIRYMIMGKTSPLAKDEKTIREVCAVFGLRDVDKKQFYELKLALYDAVVDGESNGDKFINFAKFEELTEGNVTRKSAFLARTAISDNIVGYKDRAWWIMSGRSFEEKLMDIKPQEAAFREQILIDEVVKNPNVRDRLLSVMGEVGEITIEDLRDLDRPTLQRKYKEKTGKFENVKKEELVKLMCDELNIKYVEPT